MKPEEVAIRDASSESKSTRTAKQQARQIGDLMRTVSAFAFLTCAGCGLKMKIPPEYKGKQVKCPRCKKFKLNRLIGAGTGIIFKGSGFYETDYKRKESKKSEQNNSEKQSDQISPKKNSQQSSSIKEKNSKK